MATPIDVWLTIPSGSDGTLYTMPEGYWGFFSSLVIYNPTGGTLNVTFKVKETDSSTITYGIFAITTLQTRSFESAPKLLPLTLSAGKSVLLNGSGTTMVARASGLRYAL